MNLTLTVPSKTFLVGEYSVLVGGPAVLLNTEPRFRAEIKTVGEGLCAGIHPQSPAGRWVRQNRADFESVDFEFHDPHRGRGGFGASGAQFLMVWTWSQVAGKNLSDYQSLLEAEKAWKDFRSVFEQEANLPSGADVISQFFGGILWTRIAPFAVSSVSWPFLDLEFFILPTGKKIATHTHISNLDPDGLFELRDRSARVCETLKNSQQTEFIQRLNEFSSELERQGKLADHSRVLVKSLLENENILAAKGCGALGSDVVLAIFEKEKASEVRTLVNDLGLEVLASSNGTTEGLQLQMQMNRQEAISTTPKSENV